MVYSRNVNGSRYCTGCEQWLPADLEHFYTNRIGSDGLTTKCKDCLNAQVSSYASANKEKLKIANREWQKKNPKRVSESSMKWQRANREKVKIANREWVAKNKDHIKERTKKYMQANPEKYVVNEHKRRARKSALPATFTADDWQCALDYFNGSCAVCGRQLNDLFGTHKAAQDHWIPLIKGGGYVPENMIPLCHGQDGCNNSKHARDPIEWLTERYGTRKAKQILKRVNDYFEWVKQQKESAA